MAKAVSQRAKVLSNISSDTSISVENMKDLKLVIENLFGIPLDKTLITGSIQVHQKQGYFL